MESYKAQILRLVDSRAEKFTPGELKITISRNFGLEKKKAAELIRSLVTEGDLSYADQHGRTIIEISFQRPVQVSPRIVMLPADIPYTPEAGMIALRLVHGVSFGTGQHPTTRMSLAGIDLLLAENSLSSERKNSRVLDIGTGSGVLAIAALKLGTGEGMGLDTDPCARSEAGENARINGLADRLEISDCSLESLAEDPEQRFDLICANLRLPTLKQMHPLILRLAGAECGLMISGIHPEEVPVILDMYLEPVFHCIRQQEEKGWAMLAFRKTPLP